MVCGFSGDPPDIQSLGFNLVNTRWDPKETGSLALDTHPSVQSGQHPLAPKGDGYPACLPIPRFNLVSTRWHRRGIDVQSWKRVM